VLWFCLWSFRRLVVLGHYFFIIIFILLAAWLRLPAADTNKIKENEKYNIVEKYRSSAASYYSYYESQINGRELLSLSLLRPAYCVPRDGSHGNSLYPIKFIATNQTNRAARTRSCPVAP